MRICLALVTGLWVATTPAGGTALAAARAAQQPSEVAKAPERSLVKEYCVSCHNSRLRSGGLALDALDPNQLGVHTDVWEKVVRKLRVRAMPPAGARQPEQRSVDAFLASITTELDRIAAVRPNPGAPALHRLNRTEYARSIRDLLALDGVDVTAMLPADDTSYGFDNIADVLGTSPSLLERYLSAARQISRLAIGDPILGKPRMTTYQVPPDETQTEHIEGLPLGTRGGRLIQHYFPLNGEYLIKMRLTRNSHEGIYGLARQQALDLSLDGQRVQRFSVGVDKVGVTDLSLQGGKRQAELQQADDHLEIRLPITAGEHTITVAFAKESPGVNPSDLRKPFLNTNPTAASYIAAELSGVRMVTILGPFGPTSFVDTPSRRRIFVCQPSASSDELPCARKIISTLARRAYRRPVTERDMQPLLTTYAEGRAEGVFQDGIQRALRAILAHPEFLFRFERDPANIAPGTAYRISDIELASRLSFFLWSSIPDDELLAVAERGQLRNPVVLEQQIRRMIADSRSEALTYSFAGEWLQLRLLRATRPNNTLYPDFDDNLRQAMRRETELFFESVLRENRSVTELLTANYTFVNERLAKHYGIPNVYGTNFRRVTLTDPQRFGLLGQASILTVTSNAARTKPVVRGKWILENILGNPPPPPPPDVPPLKENGEDGRVLSMRQRMEEHRTNPVCASCHAVMDPMGLSLESFDATGRLRTRGESNELLNTSGSLPDGTKFDGVTGLRQVLLRHPQQFITTVTEKLLTYALGRGLEPYDPPAVRAIMRSAARDNSSLMALILGVVKSPPFQMRQAAAPAPTQTSASSDSDLRQK